ncbi:hypothetical protein [Bradyrhizobium sp.]|jgi:hypothetical protein|uniref:hypothetical protein n=1 Tax=Bradyrhizobium sp. TaxID=376 RepID=UPI003C23796F
MDVQVTGAGIGRQFIGGDVNHFEWSVAYQRNGGGRFYHSVSSRVAPEFEQAIHVAKHELTNPSLTSSR